MTAKEYLRQAYRLNERINSHIEELENLRDLSTRIQGVSYGEHIPSPNRPTDAPFAKVLFKIMDYQEKINHEIDTLVDLKAEMEDAIEKLSNVDERLLLRYRYLDNHSWEEIGVLLNASVRTVHRIHSSALQNFSVPD